MLVPATVAGFLQYKPRGFDAMARVYGAPEVGIYKFTIRPYGLEQALELGMDEVFLKPCDALVNLAREPRLVNGPAKTRANVDENHDDAVALQLYLGLKLGCEIARGVEEAQRVVKNLQCTAGKMPVARGQGILAHGNGCEGFREDVAALSQGASVGGNREVHVSVAVEAVFFDEVDSASCRVKILLPLLHVVVGESADERKAALEPHALGRIHERSVAVQTGVDAAVLAVPAMFEPEGHDVCRQVVPIAPGPMLKIVSLFHSRFISSMFLDSCLCLV